MCLQLREVMSFLHVCCYSWNVFGSLLMGLIDLKEGFFLKVINFFCDSCETKKNPKKHMQ